MRALLIACLIALSLPPPAWAALARLVRQEVRGTANGERVLVCVYAAGEREVERVYPMGNFCPQYTDA